MTVRVLLVGCGNMGYAMLSGWLSSGKLASSETLVVEPNEDLRASGREARQHRGGLDRELPAEPVAGTAS